MFDGVEAQLKKKKVPNRNVIVPDNLEKVSFIILQLLMIHDTSIHLIKEGDLKIAITS
jgi:hypothetical protein